MVEEEEEGEEEEEKINPSSQKLISNPETLSKLASMSHPAYLKNNKYNFQQQFSSIPPPLPPPNSAFNSDTPPALPPPNPSTPPPLPPPNPKSPTRLQLASNNSKPIKTKSKHFLHLKKFKQPSSSKSVTTKYNNYTSRSNQSSPIKKSTNQSISPTKKSTLRSNSLKEFEPRLYTQEWYKQDFFKNSLCNGVTLEITGTVLFSSGEGREGVLYLLSKVKGSIILKNHIKKMCYWQKYSELLTWEKWNIDISLIFFYNISLCSLA